MGITFSICPGRDGINEEHKTEFNYQSENIEQGQVLKIEETKQEVDEETKNNKAGLIQSNWKKKREKQNLIERIKVLDSTLNNLGKFISVDNMKSKLDSRVQEVLSKLKEFRGTQDDKESFDTKLTFRQPFQFNLNDSIYHGQWNRDGLREGYGLFITDDNIVMEGLWKEGKLFKGRIFREDGSYYEGQINDYKANGHGIINFINGDFYQGRWNEFLQIGTGSRIFHDGYKYEGSFESDHFYEVGKFLWPDGSIYEGNFENSSFKGKGVYKTLAGEIYEGIWNNNVPNGAGTYKFTGKNNGVVYEGDYKHGKKEGRGKLTFSDEKYFEGEWVNGLPHGQGIFKNGETTHRGLWRYGYLVFTNAGNSAKKEEISVPSAKENFKDKKHLCHLKDQVDGEIIGEEKSNRKGKNYKPNDGKDILKFVSKISKETNHNENYVSTAI